MFFVQIKKTINYTSKATLRQEIEFIFSHLQLLIYSQMKIFDDLRRLLLHTIVIMRKKSIKLYFLYQLYYHICFFIFLFIMKS